MFFAQGSVQRLATLLVSFQAKFLVADAADADNLFFTHARTTDDGKKLDAMLLQQAVDAGSLFSAHTRITVDEKTNSKTGRSSSGIGTPLPNTISLQRAADAGILLSSHWSTGGNHQDTRNPRSVEPLFPNTMPPHLMADAGILFSSHANIEGKNNNDGAILAGTISSSQQVACSEGYIDCYDGWTYKYQDGSWVKDITCREACNGACCISSDDYSPGYHACDHFTGKVCKDGSCNGEFACYRVHIQYVVNSCIGNGACCEKFGYDGGVSGSVINSCQGFIACQLIGSRAQDGGEARNVIDSCVGDAACSRLGMYGSFEGDVINSCNGYNACLFLGYNGIVTGSIMNSCNFRFACELLAQEGGAITHVTSSCNAQEACHGAGSLYCLDFDEVNGCYEFDGGEISTPMNGCCNENYACNFTREDTLPEQCWSPHPTVSFSPSAHAKK